MGNIADIYGGGFDTDSEEPIGEFTPLPAGWYPVEVTAADIKNTNAGNGQYLKLELEVIGDDYNGRKIFTNINLANPSQKAVEIGRRELAGLGKSCGLQAIQDSDDLLGKRLQVRVKIEHSDQYGDDNSVKAYKALEGDHGEVVATPSSQPQAAPAAAPAAAAPPKNAKRPWEK